MGEEEGVDERGGMRGKAEKERGLRRNEGGRVEEKGRVSKWC